MMDCICVRGWVPPKAKDVFASACPICLGKGTVSFYRLAQMTGVHRTTLLRLDSDAARTKAKTAVRILDAEGPWRVDGDDKAMYVCAKYALLNMTCDGRHGDVEFCAAARDFVPWACERIEVLEAMLNVCRIMHRS